MNKKALFITIQIFILIVAVFSPKIVAENQLSALEETTGFRLFEFNTTTDIKEISDFSKPISLGSSESVDITVSFKFELPKFFPKLLLGTKIGNWIIFRDRNHNMTVDIQLKLNENKIPEWCDAKLENEVITIDNITTEAKSVTTKLNITIKDDAPALEKVAIELSAIFTPDSKWGLKPSEDIENFTIISGYNGSLQAEFLVPKNTTKIITKPDEYTIIPVKIKNIGNGESLVSIEINNDIQTGWNITLEPDNITIPAGETKTINVNITPPQVEEEKTMNLSIIISSKSTSEITIDQEYLKGEKIELAGIQLVKEKAVLEIDLTIITLGVVVIIVSLIVIILFFKKKK